VLELFALHVPTSAIERAPLITQWDSKLMQLILSRTSRLFTIFAYGRVTRPGLLSDPPYKSSRQKQELTEL